MDDLKSAVREKHITNTELIKMLGERGIRVQPPEMSQILNGTNTTPKAERVKDVIKSYIGQTDCA